MRIISGKHKGARFSPPRNLAARPTTDQAKESLFNIFMSNYYDSFEDMAILDLFAGTGSISYEFASRGCNNITTIDINARHVRYIEKTAEDLQMQDAITVHKAEVKKFLNNKFGQKYDLIFADPPYGLEEFEQVVDWVINSGKLSDKGLFVIEHSQEHDFSKHSMFANMRKYGKVHFTFFDPELLENK